MNKKNKLKAILAIAVALAFLVPTSAVFANDERTLAVQPVMSILPATLTKNIGDTFTVDVYIDPEDYLISGANVNLLSFNQTVIHATEPTAVTFSNFFSQPKLQGYGTVDNVAGKITGIYELTVPFVGVGTEGTWVTIEFTAVGAGTSPITMDSVGLPDENGNKIEPITVFNGEVIVTGEVFYTLDISVDGSGTTDPVPGTYSYPDGKVVDLEAIPDLGWSFDHWVGDVADPNSDVTNITMNENKAVTAYFTEDCYTLTVSIVGDGAVNVDPYKTCYLYGESVNLTAVPDTSWEFDAWSGDLTGSKNPETIIMDSNKHVTATFKGEGDDEPPVTKCILDPPEPNGDNGWYTVPVKVTLIATDEGSGVASTWYRWEDHIYKWYDNKPFIVSGDKIHTVEYFSIDRANNVEEIKECIIKIDTTPPVTTHTFDGLMGESGWFIDDVTVTLSARDVTSGVNYTMYKINDSDWEKYNESFVITKDGTYTISYYSVDLAGHKEINRTAILKIEKDDDPPITEHDFSGIVGKNDWYVSDVMVTLNAEDNAAGVASTHYKLDDDIEWQNYTGLFYVTEDGDHTIMYYSVDNVGNVEDNKSAPFKIDKTSPTIVLDAEGAGSTWLLKANVSDEHSGIDKVEFFVAGGYLGNDTSEPYEWEYTGARRGDIAQAIAYDNAGNLKISNEKESQSQDQDAFIGYTFLIGLISNVEEAENIITAQAIRLRYIEVAPTGIAAGFVLGAAVEFSSHNIVGRIISRPFGRMLLVFGIFKGGITIENE